jgi:hypothetical protein
MAILIFIAGISLLVDSNLDTFIRESRSDAQLLINHSYLHSIIQRVKGAPIKIDSLEVAEINFPDKPNWENAKILCAALGDGWRLPTKKELNDIYHNKNKISGLTNEIYWSSTYNNDLYSGWEQNFKDGKQSTSFVDSKFSVRAVRTASLQVDILTT